VPCSSTRPIRWPCCGRRSGAEQAAVFADPGLRAVAEEEGLASPAELTAIANAWRRWGRDPGATATRYWFEAVARRPDGSD
jgi:hypothetical protein